MLPLEGKGDTKGTFAEMEKAVDLGFTTEPKPGWLAYAHLALGRELKATDKDKTAGHFNEYLRLAPLDDAYRDEATQAIA